jgi:hypothetical protein
VCRQASIRQAFKPEGGRSLSLSLSCMAPIQVGELSCREQMCRFGHSLRQISYRPAVPWLAHTLVVGAEAVQSLAKDHFRTISESWFRRHGVGTLDSFKSLCQTSSDAPVAGSRTASVKYRILPSFLCGSEHMCCALWSATCRLMVVVSP